MLSLFGIPTYASRHPLPAKRAPSVNASLRETLRGWELILLLPIFTFIATPASCSDWVWMWSLSASIFVGCKWLTGRRTPVAGISRWKQAAYLLAWPGLDAEAFLRSDANVSQPSRRDWTFAAVKFLFGCLMFWLTSQLTAPGLEVVRAWCGMIGIVFLLHFGSFHLLSCLWRAQGIDAKPLMDWPIASTSVSEFWGRRWNRAFRDLTHRFLFRPLNQLIGARWGIVAGFLFSGIVHELVITVPARGGYGGPTLFFAIQSAALLLERSRVGRRLGLGRGIAGWIFTVSALILPAGLLFPKPFLQNIIIPMVQFVMG